MFTPNKFGNFKLPEDNDNSDNMSDADFSTEDAYIFAGVVLAFACVKDDEIIVSKSCLKVLVVAEQSLQMLNFSRDYKIWSLSEQILVGRGYIIPIDANAEVFKLTDAGRKFADEYKHKFLIDTNANIKSVLNELSYNRLLKDV